MSSLIPIQRIVELPMLANDDMLQRSKGRLLTWAPFVYQDMNLSVLREATRRFFQINKMTNTIDLPCDRLDLSSVSVVDRWGNQHPVYRNDKLHNDIVDISAVRDCGCEYNCGYKLCSTIKKYEACYTDVEDKMPDGTPVTFTCLDRKAILGDTFYHEYEEPLRVYESGVWVNTIKVKVSKELCKVEINANGCICDTTANLDNICRACGLHDDVVFGGTANCPPKSHPNARVWIYFCDSKLDWLNTQCGCLLHCNREFNNIYNINEAGNQLIFPHNFGFDKVLIRWYVNPDLKDIKVPMIAVPTFIMGLKAFDADFNDRKQNLATVYNAKYSRWKFGLSMELNRFRACDLVMMITPPVCVPSELPYLYNGWSELSY